MRYPKFPCIIGERSFYCFVLLNNKIHFVQKSRLCITSKQERFQEGPTDSFIRQWRKTSSSWAQPFMASSNQIMRNHGTIVNPKPYRALVLLRRVLIDLGSPILILDFAACWVELWLSKQANKQALQDSGLT
jgi:hypothetical protein